MIFFGCLFMIWNILYLWFLTHRNSIPKFYFLEKISKFCKMPRQTKCPDAQRDAQANEMPRCHLGCPVKSVWVWADVHLGILTLGRCASGHIDSGHLGLLSLGIWANWVWANWVWASGHISIISKNYYIISVKVSTRQIHIIVEIMDQK